MPKNPLNICYPPEDFGEGAAKGFGPVSDHFQSPGGFFFLYISFVKIVLNARFSVSGKVLGTELFTEFWYIPIPWCVSTVFGKLLSLES